MQSDCTTCILADRSVFMDCVGYFCKAVPPAELAQNNVGQCFTVRTVQSNAGQRRTIHNAGQLQDSAGLCRTVKVSQDTTKLCSLQSNAGQCGAMQIIAGKYRQCWTMQENA
jgi:hypothetical protein